MISKSLWLWVKDILDGLWEGYEGCEDGMMVYCVDLQSRRLVSLRALVL